MVNWPDSYYVHFHQLQIPYRPEAGEQFISFAVCYVQFKTRGWIKIDLLAYSVTRGAAARYVTTPNNR